MKFGILFLPTYVPELDGSEAQAYQNMLEQVDRAEALGFESVWLTEHHFQYYGGLVPSPPILAAAITQRTRRIRIGMAVTLLPFHRPVRVAEDMAMVDILSGGRLDWGVGRGFLNWEYQNLGVPVEESRDRFAEGLDIVLKAWAEDSFTFEGRFYQYRDLSVVPRPLQRPAPANLVRGERLRGELHSGRPARLQPDDHPAYPRRRGYPPQDPVIPCVARRGGVRSAQPSGVRPVLRVRGG